MKVVLSEGRNQQQIGFNLGCQLVEDIKHNISLGTKSAKARGVTKQRLSQLSERYIKCLSDGTINMMEGLSQGSRIPFQSILNLNILQDLLCSDGCTTFAAVGEATDQGGAILLKNRDVPANSPAQGRYYYENRQINVIQVLKNSDGNVTVGVTTAGSTGIVMGLSKHGIATASNQGCTKDLGSMAGIGVVGGFRGQLMREGLEQDTVQDAVKHVTSRLVQVGMENPGILWFVDSNNIYVIEGAPREFSVQHLTAGFTVRSNHFILLDHLNDDNISCICRYSRGKQLLTENYGKINRERMMEFSMDHKNGPGENSICEHSRDPERVVTESAAIMELNNLNPQKSKISIALGSPCRAWRSSGGNFTFQMDDDIEKIPKKFLDGSVYKEFIKKEPWNVDI